MSKNAYFYEISPVTDKTWYSSEEIYTDSIANSDNLYYVREDIAPAWIKKVGILRRREFTYLNPVDACEEIFGKRPDCYSFESSGKTGKDYMYIFHMADGTEETALYSTVRRYRKHDSEMCYFCMKKYVSEVEGAWRLGDKLLEKYCDRLLNRKDVLRMAGQYFKLNEQASDSYSTSVMWDIMKSYFSCPSESFILVTVE